MGNKYGQRWTGWLTPDETTNYRFYVTADDAYELRLSTDDSREHLTLISSRGSWVGSRGGAEPLLATGSHSSPEKPITLSFFIKKVVEAIIALLLGRSWWALILKMETNPSMEYSLPTMVWVATEEAGVDLAKPSNPVVIGVSGGDFDYPFYTFTIDGGVVDSHLMQGSLSTGKGLRFRRQGYLLQSSFCPRNRQRHKFRRGLLEIQ